MHDTSKYKTELETQLDTIIQELEQIAEYDTRTGDWYARPTGTAVGTADENVEADEVEDWNERRATLSQLEIRYNNIKHALKKIADSDYGICEVSGEPIEVDRLDANPAARTCKQHLDQEDTLAR